MIELSTRPAKGGPNGETLTWQEWLVYGKRYDPEKLESAFRVSPLYLCPSMPPLND